MFCILILHCTMLNVHYFQCFGDCFFSVELISETSSTSRQKTSTIVIVIKASTPSLIMSIKSQFPLILAYACLGCHHDTFYRWLNLFLCMTYHFYHSSKQTTILADLGVVYYHVAPATITAYCMLRGYNEATL